MPDATVTRTRALRLGVAGEHAEVVQADERLHEAVEDLQAGGEGVLQVVRAARLARHLDALGRGGAEEAQALAQDGQQLGGATGMICATRIFIVGLLARICCTSVV